MLQTIQRPTFITSDSRCRNSSSHGPDPHHGCESPDCEFQVAWQINPHMKVGGTDSRAALAEHRELRRALIEAGAAVFEVPFVHGAFDSVFVKDNAVLAVTDEGPRAFMARPKCLERRVEQVARARALQSLGFESLKPNSDTANLSPKNAKTLSRICSKCVPSLMLSFANSRSCAWWAPESFRKK
jgi:hypothetical protein